MLALVDKGRVTGLAIDACLLDTNYGRFRPLFRAKILIHKLLLTFRLLLR